MILGASFDAPAENKAFADAQEFPYRLLSDTSKAVGTEYGVKRAEGEQYADFPKRITYLIDPTGIVRKVYEVTDVAKNPQDVLDDIEELGA